MYQALYRKYRPKSFHDVVSQEIVKKILINSIKNNKISHAYLFSGPRGIGKTSIAKIFAKAVNCMNFDQNDDSCLECQNCLDIDDNSPDILEIDAASNNGVDQIRELKSKVNIVPSKLKYKVYIIDEVHMLSNSAFNALLKTLEEPPSHVIFILATTEFYEVPETIVSRCQCFSFKRITNEELKNRLRYISDTENITVDDDVLLEIATYANGGLRDAISMLDKLASFSNNNITMEDFITINGLVSQSDIVDTYNNLLAGNVEEILEIINKIDSCGYDFGNFIERLMIYTRDLIVHSFLENDKNIDVKVNISLVNKLNDLLNNLKICLNPLVMTQISLLDYIKSKNEVVNENINYGNTLNNENNINIENKINTVKKQESIISNINNSNSMNSSNNITNSNNTNNANNIKSQPKEEVIIKKDTFYIDDNVKKCRINNALAEANLSFKNSFLSNYSKIQEYRLDEKYAKVVQLLDMATPLVVSYCYVILGSKRDATVERMYENHEEIEKLLQKITNHSYRSVYISEKDFEIIKNKYINDKKNGIIYKCQDEDGILVHKENNKKNNELVNKALNLFGSDLVEIEEE